MSVNGKLIIMKKLSGFSLVEIIVSLAIFSFIMTSVIGITISLTKAEQKIQAQLFLAQAASMAIDNMSRELRYGYNYTGSTQTAYDNSAGGQTIIFDTKDTTLLTGSASTNEPILKDAPNSPFVLFEKKDGNPQYYYDQLAYCMTGGKLYKIDFFQIQTNNTTFSATCSSGKNVLPSDITISNLSFDVLAETAVNPKNPMIRIKFRLTHPDGGIMDIQTTVTQRLVTYF